MEVVVLSHTMNPEITCAVSMRSTRTREPAHKLLKEFEWISKCKDSTLLYDESYQKIDELDNGVRHIKYYDCKYKNGNKCGWYGSCAERLLKKAKKMKHWGVLEHVSFTVSVSGLSRSCTHQLVRHRHFSFLQSSSRQIDFSKFDVGDFIVPKTCEGVPNFRSHLVDCKELYGFLLSKGVPKEDARFILPQATPQHIVITGNSRSWWHFFFLRFSKQAQWEIKEMARKILDEFMKISPLIFEGAGEVEV